MRIKITTCIDVPDGSTHYHGDLLDNPSFYKCTQVGVVGDHWWYWHRQERQWKLSGHHKPHWIHELGAEMEVYHKPASGPLSVT